MRFEDPSPFDSGEERFDPETDITFEDRARVDRFEEELKDPSIVDGAYITSMYVLGLEDESAYTEMPDEEVDNFQDDLREPMTDGMVSVEEKLDDAMILLFNGVDPQLKHVDFKEMKNILDKEKEELILDDSILDSDWQRFNEAATRLKILNQLPNDFVNDELVKTWQKRLRQGMAMGDIFYEAEFAESGGVNFPSVVDQAAKMKILGHAPKLAPGFWTQARVWMDQHREDMDEESDELSVHYYSEFLRTASSLAILAADKVEIPPEGGLVLDGKRIGKTWE